MITKKIIVFIILFEFLFIHFSFPIAVADGLKFNVREPLWHFKSDSPRISISHDGKYITVCGFFDKYVTLLDRNGKMIWQFTNNTHIKEITISLNSRHIAAHDGEFLYYFHRESNIPIWDIHAIDFNSPIFLSGNGKNITFVYNDTLCIVNEYKKLLFAYKPSGSFEFSNSRDGKYIAIAENRTVKIFNIGSRKLISIFNLNHGVGNIQLTEHGNYFLIQDSNDNIFLYNSTSKEPIWTKLTKKYDSARSKISSDGKFIIKYSRYREGKWPNDRYIDTLNIFDINKNISLWNTSSIPDDYIFGPSISDNGEKIIIWTGETILSYNRESTQPIWGYNCKNIKSATISSNGNYVLVTTNETIYFFDNSIKENSISLLHAFYIFISRLIFLVFFIVLITKIATDIIYYRKQIKYRRRI